MSRESVHFKHCNQGDYSGSCKYGDDEGCPALNEPVDGAPEEIERNAVLHSMGLAPDQKVTLGHLNYLLKENAELVRQNGRLKTALRINGYRWGVPAEEIDRVLNEG